MWGQFALISFQPHSGYRGIGIAFNVAKWALLKKKPTEHGTWFLLQHIQSCQRIWCGSGYFSTGVSNHDHASEISAFLAGLPATAEPVVLGADCNTALGWTLNGDQKRPSCGAGKTLALLDQMLARRLHPIPQEDVGIPTYWTRKMPSRSSQIDAVFCNVPKRCSEVIVAQDSRRIINTDHDYLQTTMLIAPGKIIRKQRRGGPRVMKQGVSLGPEDVACVSQPSLERLAARVTEPPPAVKFVVPEGVKELGAIARASRLPCDWIKYCRELRNARVHWREQKFSDAAGDWGAFKWVKRQRTNRWQENFASSLDGHPTEVITQHFQTIFCREMDPSIDVQLRHLQERLGHNFIPFTRNEIVHGGDNLKCTGPDGVPQELLKAVCQVDEGLDALRTFFSGVLEAAQHPEGWYQSLMSLLPKKLVPTSARDLRPICVTSHLSKTFSRLVMQRIIQHVTPDTPFQCCAPKRLLITFGPSTVSCKFRTSGEFRSLPLSWILKRHLIALIAKPWGNCLWMNLAVIFLQKSETCSPCLCRERHISLQFGEKGAH